MDILKCSNLSENVHTGSIANKSHKNIDKLYFHVNKVKWFNSYLKYEKKIKEPY